MCVYLCCDNQGCASPQSEGRDQREELWQVSAASAKAVKLGDRERPLVSGKRGLGELGGRGVGGTHAKKKDQAHAWMLLMSIQMRSENNGYC